MDSDDEVIGASFRAEKLPLETETKLSLTVKREGTLPAQAPGIEKGYLVAEKAALLKVIWARVKGFPPWPVSSTWVTRILPKTPRLVQAQFICTSEVPGCM